MLGNICAGKKNKTNERGGEEARGGQEDPIVIRYLGFGIKEVRHVWPTDKYTYTADELSGHLINKMIPLESE